MSTPITKWLGAPGGATGVGGNKRCVSAVGAHTDAAKAELERVGEAQVRLAREAGGMEGGCGGCEGGAGA